MANPGLFHGHTVVRILQILTLISAWALLASIVSDYNSQSANTPGKVLLLFIVCILASVWSICVLITVLRARNSALWIALWDLVAMGLLIAGVVAISGIVNYDCTAIRVTSLPSRDYVAVDANGNPLPSRPSVAPNTDDNDDAAEFSTGRDGTVFWSSRNRCSLLRTAWTLAIINILLFFISALLALIIWRQNESEERRVVVNGRRKRNGVLLNNNPVVVEKVYVSEPEQAAFRTRRDREESRREREERRRSRDERRRSRIEDYV